MHRYIRHSFNILKDQFGDKNVIGVELFITSEQEHKTSLTIFTNKLLHGCYFNKNIDRLFTGSEQKCMFFGEDYSCTGIFYCPPLPQRIKPYEISYRNETLYSNIVHLDINNNYSSEIIVPPGSFYATYKHKFKNITLEKENTFIIMMENEFEPMDCYLDGGMYNNHKYNYKFSINDMFLK